MTIYGVDVSAYQGKPDWAKVQSSGVAFAFAKATQGTTYTASTWAFDQDAMAKLTGFLPGAYHFLSATDDPAAQARYFVSKLKNPEKQAIGLDVERYADSAGKVHRPTAGQAKAWADEFRRLLPGHPLLGYIPRWYWDELGRPALTFVDALWASSYVSGSGSPSVLYAKTSVSQWASYGGRAVELLQYTESGRVAGVDGSVDTNAYKGALPALELLTLGSGARPVPPPVSGPPIPHPPLSVDGVLGRLTVKALQMVTAWRLHTSTAVDGSMSKSFVRLLQLYLRVKADGDLGPITVKALQRNLGIPQDGNWGSKTTMALQRALNMGKF